MCVPCYNANPFKAGKHEMCVPCYNANPFKAELYIDFVGYQNEMVFMGS